MRAAIAALLFLFAACRSLPAAPTRAADDAAFEAPAAVVLPGLAADPAPREIVLPGDVIAMKSFSVAPLDVSDLVVDAAGMLHVPVAGAVEVGGLTIEDAARLVEQKLRPFDARAQVQLRLTASGGHHATVIGSVAAPGMFPIAPGLRVADLVAKAGGPLQQISEGEQVPLGDLEAGRVLRDGAPLPVSLARALEGAVAHNVLIHAGDLVVIPPARGQRISILGEVKQAKAVPFRPGLRLSDSLAMAGGTTAVGDGGDIRLVRGPLSKPRVYRASLDALVRGNATDVQLEPGDVVLVTETWFGSATDVLARLTPLLYAATLARSIAIAYPAP